MIQITAAGHTRTHTVTDACMHAIPLKVDGMCTRHTDNYNKWP